MVPCEKQNTTLYISDFKKEVTYSFVWIFNAKNIENEAAYIEFIGKAINSLLSDHLI